ncbi:hypothetical protein [Bosea sp. NBC_00550]|uniref:hypothetical protein n=1 Tax=Bosea sp. NBC_00550 TaxID=2969621 RepID=UPI0022318778|nr:hypothetical protein [Bosea sp. NBC_00550]UZF93729.1 hypothetical protein NWE53_05920 [Bosea sp. NBC_00550]
MTSITQKKHEVSEGELHELAFEAGAEAAELLRWSGPVEGVEGDPIAELAALSAAFHDARVPTVLKKVFELLHQLMPAQAKLLWHRLDDADIEWLSGFLNCCEDAETARRLH